MPPTKARVCRWWWFCSRDGMVLPVEPGETNAETHERRRRGANVFLTDCVRCCWQKYEQERDLGSHRLKYCQRFIIGRINGPGIPCISFVSVPCSTCHPFLSLLRDKDSATLRPKKHRPLRSPSESSWRKTKVARPRKKKRDSLGPRRMGWLLIRGSAFSLIPRARCDEI